MTALEDGWMDVTVPLEPGMITYPGNPPFQMWRSRDMANGDTHNATTISMGVHTGTHIDAPAHFLEAGVGTDSLPLSAVLGRARVIDIDDPEVITAAELEEHALGAGERVLFRTRNSGECWPTRGFAEDFVHLSPAAADHLAGRRLRLVGVDHLSAGPFRRQHTVDVHRALLGAGIWILEGLDLSAVAPGDYELLCLPLRIVDCDGAPARVLVRPLSGAPSGEA
jgi:arylformamidase